jgi:putative transposase
MSRPRQILPGGTYLITRRTLRRHLLLRPDSEMRELVVYLLAVSAERSGILVHGFCAMSTHMHLVVTDPRGELPCFLEYFHRLLALATKVLRKWEGAVWDHEQTSVVRLETSEAIVDKLGYVLANPVAAGLVRYARDWPGAKSHPEDLGGATMRAPRPRVYLNVANERWPTVAALELTLPLGVDADDAGAWRNAVKAAVAEHEVRGRAEVARQGWKFLGAERAESVSPYDRATSFEPLRGRNPTFAVGVPVLMSRPSPRCAHFVRRTAQRSSVGERACATSCFRPAPGGWCDGTQLSSRRRSRRESARGRWVRLAAVREHRRRAAVRARDARSGCCVARSADRCAESVVCKRGAARSGAEVGTQGANFPHWRPSDARSERRSRSQSGRPGRLPARGSHRSGRADFPHPALRGTVVRLPRKRGREARRWQWKTFEDRCEA